MCSAAPPSFSLISSHGGGRGGTERDQRKDGLGGARKGGVAQTRLTAPLSACQSPTDGEDGGGGGEDGTEELCRLRKDGSA